MAGANRTGQVKIGLLQLPCGEDREENLRRAIEAAEAAADQGAQILCFQELFASRYFCQTEDARFFDWAEPVSGPAIARLRRLAARRKIALIAPFFERRAPGLCHNSAAVIDADGSLLGLYRKVHIPDDPQFHEKFYFAPGDLGFRAWRTRYGVIGVLICWDQWFPEAARLTAMAGAQILFCPTAIGWLPGEKEGEGRRFQEAWRTIQRAHAIANGCFLAAVNRVGFEPVPAGPEAMRAQESASRRGIEFWGSSFVAGPLGELLAEAPEDCPALLLAEADLSRIERVRAQWPFFRDRRPEAYKGLGRLFGESAGLSSGPLSGETSRREGGA